MDTLVGAGDPICGVEGAEDALNGGMANTLRRERRKDDEGRRDGEERTGDVVVGGRWKIQVPYVLCRKRIDHPGV